MGTHNPLTDLPHAVHLKEVIKLLAGKYQPLHIICFYKSVMQNQLEGCFLEEAQQTQVNYYLLIIMQGSTKIEHEVQDFVNGHYKHGMMITICHSLKNIVDGINQNHRFYRTICSKGTAWYNHDGIALNNNYRPYIPTRAAIKAEQQYTDHISLAEGFVIGATKCLSESRFPTCVFLLHQVAEQCLSCLIQVHLGYRADIHNLQRLLALTSSFSDRPTAAMLSGSLEDSRLFEILRKSYSDARYLPGYSISEADASTLHTKVEGFFKLTESMCIDHIDLLKIQSSDYQQAKHLEIKVC
jgi:HEPN domain-containing protein